MATLNTGSIKAWALALFLALGAASLPARAADLGDVYTIGASRYFDSSYPTKYFFWAKIAVRKGHQFQAVKVRWSANQWASFQDSVAAYDGEENASHDRYIVKQYLGWEYCKYGYCNGDAIKTPILMKSWLDYGNGYSRWEAHSDSLVESGVFPGAPVRRVSDEVVGENGQYKLKGEALAWNFPGSQARVDVIYSTDGWKTTQVAQATTSDRSRYRFELAFAGSPALPSEIRYAIRYTVDGQESWDSAGGANFQRQMEPRTQLRNGYGSTFKDGDTLSGSLDLALDAWGDLKLESYESAIDGTLKFQGRAALDSSALPAGDHELVVTARYQGGIRREYRARFKTTSVVAPSEEWIVPVPANAPAPADSFSANRITAMATGADDKIYFVWDYSMIVRHEAYGQDTPELVYEAPADTLIKNLIVDKSGNVYAIGYQNVANLAASIGIHKFGADGKRDVAFGDYGWKKIAEHKLAYLYEPRYRDEFLALSPDGARVTALLSPESTWSLAEEDTFRLSTADGKLLSSFGAKKLLTGTAAYYQRLNGIVDRGEKSLVIRGGSYHAEVDPSASSPQVLKEWQIARYSELTSSGDRASLAQGLGGLLYGTNDKSFVVYGLDSGVLGSWTSYSSDMKSGLKGAYLWIGSSALLSGGDAIIQVEKSNEFHGGASSILRLKLELP